MSRPVALALRALGLGDFLTGLPALALLKQALPDHDVVLAAPPVFRPLIELAPAVDALLPATELAPLTGLAGTAGIARDTAPVSVAIDLHGKGPESRRLLAALRPDVLYGFADPAVGLSGPTWRRNEHEVLRWRRLISESLGVPDTGPGVAGCLSLPNDAISDGNSPTTTVPAGLTVVHPGAAAGSRRWPASRFAEVAAQLAAEGHQVVITGGEAERELAGTVAAAAGVTPLVGLSLRHLLILIARARLVVCGDTGVAHIASNYRTPSVLLFGPVSPASWGPPTDGPHVVLWHGDGTGDPHGAEPDPALLAIGVDEVVQAVHSLSASTVLPEKPVPKEVVPKEVVPKKPIPEEAISGRGRESR